MESIENSNYEFIKSGHLHLGYIHKTCIVTPRKLLPTVDHAWSFPTIYFLKVARCSPVFIQI